MTDPRPARRRTLGTVYDAVRHPLRTFFRKHYKFLYGLSAAVHSMVPSRVFGCELLLVHPEDGRGWILETICNKIAGASGGRARIHYGVSRLPAAKAYFFCHYSLLPKCLKTNPQIWGSRILAFFTHPRDIGVSDPEFLYACNRAHRIICMNSGSVRDLVGRGVEPARVTHVLAGSDPEVFKPHVRGSGAVGLSMAFYERKSPDIVFEVVRSMPHRRFILLGKNWRDYRRFAEMSALPNFAYYEPEYRDYPEYYARMDVFLSPGKLEGGPIPLIESMMSNAVPVASRTGFAPDIIREGENGFLFDPAAPASEVCGLIEKAFALNNDIAATVQHLTWGNFARAVLAEAGLSEPAAAEARR